MFLEISQSLQENTCARASYLIKLQASACNFIKKKNLWYRCFPVNYAKFLRTPFLTEHLWWLLLNMRNEKSFLKNLLFKLLLYTTNSNILMFVLIDWFLRRKLFIFCLPFGCFTTKFRPLLRGDTD